VCLDFGALLAQPGRSTASPHSQSQTSNGVVIWDVRLPVPTGIDANISAMVS